MGLEWSVYLCKGCLWAQSLSSQLLLSILYLAVVVPYCVIPSLLLVLVAHYSYVVATKAHTDMFVHTYAYTQPQTQVSYHILKVFFLLLSN